MHGWVGVESRGLQAGFHHAQAAGGKDRPSERTVGLQADDNLVVAVDPTGSVGKHCGWRRRFDIQHALSSLFFKVGLQLLPDCQCSRRRPDKKRFVAFVRCDVANDEIAYVDCALPTPGGEVTPSREIASARLFAIPSTAFPP